MRGKSRMLPTTKSATSQTPTNAVLATSNIESRTSNVKSKSQITILAPETTSHQMQNMSDEIGGPNKSTSNINNNNSKNNNNNINANDNKTIASTSGGNNVGAPGSETAAGSGSSSNGMGKSATSNNIPNVLRQTSTNSSPSNATNCNDHSNTNSNGSNVSTGISQKVDSDQPQDEVSNKKKTSIKEEDGATTGNSTLDKVSQGISVGVGVSSSGTNSTTTTITTATNNSKGSVAVATCAVKEESTDIICNLVNMKKEESFSPNLSPVGFGSICSISGSNTGQDQSTTAVKMELNSNSKDKPSSVMGLSSEDLVACSQSDTGVLSEATNPSMNVNASGSQIAGSNVLAGLGSSHGHCSVPGSSPGVLSSPINFMSGPNSTIGTTVGHCLDYMQQQNHIFVFSTQLANKGAESVINGQFQTIIAYHCTQPATKSFLEDFFMKNPMKMNKLQRQNSMGLGICNISAPGNINQASWQSPNPNTNSAQSNPINANQNANMHLNQNQTHQHPNLVSKILQQPQKAGIAGPKPQFNNQNDSNTSKRQHFADPSQVDALVNDNDLMCWETGGGSNVNNSRNNLDVSQGSSDSHAALKLLEGVESVGLVKCGDDSNIISLQGVKVPDENLTPQQRQHREEQLAKIKKMNEFLFPENDNGLNNPNSNANSKHSNDVSMSNIIMNMSSGTNNTQQIRQIQMQAQSQSSTKSDQMSAQLGSEEILMPLPIPGDVIGDIGAVISCNNGTKGSLQCGSAVASVGGGGQGLGSGSGSVVNVLNVNINSGMPCPGAATSIMANSSDIIGAFNNPNCGVGLGGGVMGANDKSNMVTQDGIPSINQMEWPKIQQQLYEERLKGNKAQCRPTAMSQCGSGVLGPCPNPNQVSVVAPPNGPTSAPSGSAPASNMQMRNSVQGPPPPYHPTPRSASVPIAAQSPNPSSPNNLSLPSPRTVGALGPPSNSPSMELATTNTSSVITSSTNASLQNSLGSTKNCFQTDAGSPSSRHRGGNNQSNIMNHLNSNPSTPLSHLSPKELEAYNSSTSQGELKGTRPSPQRSRSPSNGNNQNIIENSTESRFSSSSPSLQFNTLTQHMQANATTAMSTYKINTSNSMEISRQNCSSGGLSGQSGASVQFGARRSDNMPLNPNSANRPVPNKISQNFDPISSLAQMSQQLTSSISSSAGGINMGLGTGAADINMEHGVGMDVSGLEHMSHPSSGLGNIPNNCHSMNPLMNSMGQGQRMLNPKICNLGHSGFNATGHNGATRDGSGQLPGAAPGPGGLHGILPPGARMIGRIPVNFGQNFNPNVQVKASTPNTIQYMPVRPQGTNNSNNNGNSNSSNVRMPPSLEFLQRYANPQMATTGGGVHPMGNESASMMIGAGTIPMNMNSPNDQQQHQAHQQNKMMNNPNGINNGIGMNFFQNCQQMPGLEDDGSSTIGVPGGLPGHEMNVGMSMSMGIGQASMIRGMRPHGMRQHPGLGSRMQSPGINVNIGNRHQGQFPGTPDSLDCNDPNVSFNNVSGSCQGGNPAMFGNVSQPQQQGQSKPHHIKQIPGGMCQTQIPSSNLISNGGGSVGGTAPGSGPGAVGVSFVGPSSSDLKYAQQYHSFQQQLYATNTRSQQQQQQGGNLITMPPNVSPNPSYFVNK
ncbi:lgs [Drosophila busckii]|uniref:Lgs n=1 Tax=Drosophila busckii TaxID=30019 RepID=A0A0M3QYS6_DROBS|nr:lgs [Drosophila busckii]